VSVGWVAGTARARLLLGHRVGREGARRLAALPPQEALAALAGTRYGGREDAGDLRGAQRAVAEALLLELRILGGWLPPGATGLVRTLAAWFELVNVEDRLAYLLGGESERPFDLGSLATAWPALADVQAPAELRTVLASSAWGDPGSEEPHDVHLALRLSWARRLLAEVPEAHAWVGGALAILLARERLLVEAEPRPDATAGLGLGPGWARAVSVPALAATLPADAAWSLEGIVEPAELWRAEAAWWRRVEEDAQVMVRGRREGRPVVVGAAALLAADARLVIAALEAAGRGTGNLEEVLGEAA
jgi:hypothetical protein